MDSAAVRAVLPQSVLLRLREAEAERAAAILAALGERVESIEKLFVLDWLPARLYLDMLEELRRGLGEPRFREVYRDGVPSALERRALRGLVETGFRLLGAGLLLLVSLGRVLIR